MTVSLSKVHTKKFSDTLAEAKALKAAIEQMTAELKVKNDALVAMAGSTIGKVTVETGDVTFSENNTYDEDAIRGALKPGQVARCEKKVLDKAVVKRLYPAVYAAAKVNRGVKVTL